MKKIHIVILIIITIAIVSISIYIELVTKPKNLIMNLEKSPFVVYMHSNLSILMDGKPIKVPSQIGIDNKLWNNHSLDKFGVPGMPMDEEGKTTMQGMAPIYTTNDKGRITVGSIIDRDYSLGEFLSIWGGLNMKNKLVNATVKGKPIDDYRNIILKDKAQIKLDVYSHQHWSNRQGR
jgi:hypothetical protein